MDVALTFSGIPVLFDISPGYLLTLAFSSFLHTKSARLVVRRTTWASRQARSRRRFGEQAVAPAAAPHPCSQNCHVRLTSIYTSSPKLMFSSSRMLFGGATNSSAEKWKSYFMR